MAWFAADADGRARLRTEQRVLRLLAQRCSFRTPRILFISADGFDLRASVPGACDPWPLYQRTKADPALARRIGAAVGEILVEQHTRIAAADLQGWLRERVPWPEPRAWIDERIDAVVEDRDLLRRIRRVVDAYEAVQVDAADRVLVHGDLGLHNLALDPDTDAVRGVFDYDGAAFADRHHDFRYLVLSIPGEPVLEAALAVYEPAVGRIDRDRVWLYNAACAISYLAYRRGVAAEQKWCGRTLAEDLQWARDSMQHIGA
jgi:aminoglycoside phosphotransferase (APT) family kinase protein